MRVIENGDAYVALDEHGRTLGAFYPGDDDPSWWTVCFPNGTDRRMWQPDGGPFEVARRAFGP